MNDKEGSEIIDFNEGRGRVQEAQHKQKLRELLDFYFSANRFDGELEDEKDGWTRDIAEIFQGRENFQPKIDNFIREIRAWLDGRQFKPGAQKAIMDDLIEVIKKYKEYLVGIIIDGAVRENENNNNVADVVPLAPAKKNDE